MMMEDILGAVASPQTCSISTYGNELILTEDVLKEMSEALERIHKRRQIMEELVVDIQEQLRDMWNKEQVVRPIFPRVSGVPVFPDNFLVLHYAEEGAEILVVTPRNYLNEFFRKVDA